MPIISRFYGIVIRMYFMPGEHNLPHIHAIYGDNAAAIDIASAKILDGYLPPKAKSLVEEWMNLHKSELLAMWDSQDVSTLPPLE